MSGAGVRDDTCQIPTGLAGLSTAEATRRLQDVGPNRWVSAERCARLPETLAVLLDPMAIMLAMAAGLDLLLGETRDGIVLALALIPVLSVDVVRDGHVHTVGVEAVVPGDLLIVREGQVVAADGVVQWASNVAPSWRGHLRPSCSEWRPLRQETSS